METAGQKKATLPDRGSGKTIGRLVRALAAASLLLAVMAVATVPADAAPTLTVGAPLAGSSTNDSTPTIAGTTSDGLDPITVDVYAGPIVAGTPLALEATPSGESWSTQAPALEDGTYTVVASQDETLTSEPGASEPVTFTVDTTPPGVSLEPIATLLDTSTPSFDGAAGALPGDAGTVSLQIYAGSSASGTPLEEVPAPVSGGGWSASSGKALVDGTYTAVAVQLDEAGNEGRSVARTFTIDTVAPKPTLDAVATPTRDSTPSFGGAAGKAAHDEQAVTVAVYAGTSVAGSPVASGAASVSAGNWSFTAKALADGTYTVQATQRDEAGNEGHTAAATFVVDTKPPAVTLNALPAFGHNSKPSLGGAAGTEAGDAASVKLAIFAGTTATGSPVETVKATPSGGTWTASPAKALKDGTYTALAEQLDEAGNIGVSSPTTFTIDTVAPKPTLDAVATPTNDATPTFEGTTGKAAHDEQAVTVAVYAGSTVSGVPVTSGAANVSGGNWSYTAAPLADGTYTVQATQRDEAGNEGHSSTATFTIDTKAPLVTLTALEALVNDATPTFSGAGGTEAGDVKSVKLAIYDGTAVAGTPVETFKAAVGGGVWSGTPSKALADGTYTAVAEQADEAGNVALSQTTTFTVKTKGPNVSLEPVPAWIRSHAPTFAGGLELENGGVGKVTLEIYPGTKEKGAEPIQSVTVEPPGTTWAATVAGELPDGTYTAEATQPDKAHNVGHSIARTFTIDTTPPALTLALSAPSTSDGLETVSGVAGIARGDRRQVTVELFAGTGTEPGTAEETVTVNASETGAWSATLAGLAPGQYTVLAHQSDEAGNVATTEPSTFTVSSTPQPPSSSGQAASPPAASFTWAPATPAVGQLVTLASSSTNGSSPIASYAWDLAGSGQLAPGTAVATTSFATPGPHVVRLQVSDDNGMSSGVAQTIDVAAAPATLMQPFPIVRIAGSETSFGARVKLLTVQAPVGAKIQVTCAGRGCKTKAENRVVAASSKAKVPAGATTVAFPRFERALYAGAKLQIRVTKAGQIGKYTSFTIRRNKLPVRSDSCLQPVASKPSACPSS